MGWVDTHCHLQLDGRDPEELLSRAVDVAWLVAPGINLETSIASIELADSHPGRVLPTAGLHPHAAETWDEQAAGIRSLAHSVSAIGETGLDFYRNLSDRDAQIASFRAQVDLAARYDLPLIVHCRDAFREIHDILEESGAGPRSILHCWTGGPKWTRRFLELDVTFSFAGPVAFDNGQTVRLGAALVPPERAMVETDTPYLAPPPHRGSKNEPAWVSFNGAALAAVWDLPVADVSAITSANATRVFKKS